MFSITPIVITYPIPTIIKGILELTIIGGLFYYIIRLGMKFLKHK